MLHFWRSPKCQHKQDAQNQIDGRKSDGDSGNALLRIQKQYGNYVAQFFNDCRQHHQAKTAGITRDHQKGNLPGQCDTSEAVVVFGMSDGRRIIAADLVFGKNSGATARMP